MDPITGALFGLGAKLIDSLFPDPEKKAQAQFELLKMQQTGDLAQLTADVQLATNQSNTNTEEAKSDRLFVSGWRPYIGWVCGTGLAYQFLIYPILVAFVPKIVQLDMGTLLTLLTGMLGLAGYRTYEKSKGVASK